MKNLARPFLFLFAFAAPLVAHAEDPPTLVVRGGHLFDAETATRRPLGQLWVAGERVLGEKPADAAIPKGVAVLDAEGATVLPGLFDLHAHVAAPGGAMGQFLMLPPAHNLASHLYCGVTNVVDLHSEPSSIFPVRVVSRGDASLARLYAAGAIFTAPGGHGTQFGIEANVVTTKAEVGQRLDALMAHRPDVIKGVLEHGGWGGLPVMPTLSDELVFELGRRANEANVPFFCHVWSLEEARSAVRAGADALAHGVYSAPVTDELLAEMKAAGTAYVPTLSVVAGPIALANKTPIYGAELVRDALHPDVVASLNDLGNESGSWAQAMSGLDVSVYLANLKRVYDAGIPVGVGTDAGNPLTPHGPAVLEEIALFVQAGLTPAQALVCATLGSARILRVDAEFGSLVPGKVADLVVVAGDPTADVAALWNVRAVVKSGALVDREAHRAAMQALRVDATTRVIGVDVLPEIDGFDDGDLACPWGGTWGVSADNLAGGNSTGEVFVRDGNLLLAGALEEGFQYGGWCSAAVDWSAGRKQLVDATGFTGIRLRVRGTPRPYTLTVNRAAVTGFDGFDAEIEITEEWREIEVPFSALRQGGFGRAIEWAADDLWGISLDARNNPFGGEVVYGLFEAEIDWITVF
jgi:imidazolonepropionase-like amidohydrolase